MGRAFRRVVVFAIRGLDAEVVATYGMSPAVLGVCLPLREQTPLRWALQAASPLVGAGSAPGGDVLARHLGLSVPRAYAVVPLAPDGRITALVYADGDSEALPLSAVAKAFAAAQEVLSGQPIASPRPRRLRLRQPRRPRANGARLLSETQPQTENTPSPAAYVASSEVSESSDAEIALFSAMVAESLAKEQVASLPPAAEEAPPAVVVPPPLPASRPREPDPVLGQAAPVAECAAIVTPQGVVPLAAIAGARQQARGWWRLGLAAAALLLLVSAAVFSALAPTEPTGNVRITIAKQSTLGSISKELQERGVVRNAHAFSWLARMQDLDRQLKAGLYELPTGAWAWQVLGELSRGQLHTVQVTIPEGLTLPEVAGLLEHQGIAAADEVLAVARDRELLDKYDIRANSAEGYLFPETYVFARGVQTDEVVETMLQQFFSRIELLPEAVRADPKTLHEKLTLASIIEREARDKSEQARIAGVFQNRLDRNMKLESCATVQYVLGHTKERLTLADVRTPSPYNTYLNLGLPPGPIANPGFDALRAAFRPEKNDYLFFFAKEDGSHRHVFTKTYAEHQQAQRALARRQ